MSVFVKDGGVWKQAGAGGLSVKDGGTWKTVASAFVKDGGVWKQFFQNLVYWISDFTESSSSNPSPRAVRIDNSGNVYVVGSYFPPSAGNPAGFIAKYNSAGTLQWIRRGTSGFSVLNDVAFDGSNNIYAVGKIGTAAFIIKYDSSGNVLAQKAITAPRNNILWGVKVNSSGDIYVCGSRDTDDGTRSQCYVATLNSSFGITFQQVIGSAGQNVDGFGLALDAVGNYYVVGSRSSRAFILKYTTTNALGFSVVLDPGVVEFFQDVTVDTNGFIYAAGFSNAASNSSAFYVRFNPSNGSIVLNRHLTNTQNSVGSVAVDSSGNVFLSGGKYIAKFNSSGSLTFIRELNRSNVGTQLNQLATNNVDSLYISGYVGDNVIGSIQYLYTAKLKMDGTQTGTYGNYTYASTNVPGNLTVTYSTNSSGLAQGTPTDTIGDTSWSTVSPTVTTTRSIVP